MADIEFTAHASNRMAERGISEEWVLRTIDSPDRTDIKRVDEVHYFKAIAERGGRVLRVAVNTAVTPARIVTAHFDRGATRRPHTA